MADYGALSKLELNNDKLPLPEMRRRGRLLLTYFNASRELETMEAAKAMNIDKACEVFGAKDAKDYDKKLAKVKDTFTSLQEAVEAIDVPDTPLPPKEAGMVNSVDPQPVIHITTVPSHHPES